MPLAWGVQFVFLSAWRWQGWCGMSRGTECRLPLACGVQLVHVVGVTSADVAAVEQLDVGEGVVRFVVRDGAHGSARVGRAAGAYRRSDGRGRRGGRKAGSCGVGGAAYRVGQFARCCLRGACGWCFLSACRWRGWCGLSRGTECTLRLVFGVQSVLFVGVAVAGVLWFVPRDSVHVSACVWRAAGAVCRRRGGRGGSVCTAGRCACWGLCLACTWCCLLASQWRTWTWAWWLGWCGMFRGTVGKLRMVFGVHIVLSVGVAVAGVVQFVPRDGVHGGACVWRAPGAVCRRRGRKRGGGHGGGGAAVCSAGRCASCGLCLAFSLCCLSASR